MLSTCRLDENVTLQVEVDVHLLQDVVAIPGETRGWLDNVPVTLEQVQLLVASCSPARGPMHITMTGPHDIRLSGVQLTREELKRITAGQPWREVLFPPLAAWLLLWDGNRVMLP